MTATAPSLDAPYAGTTRILDADSHVMELPGWLEEHAEEAVRDRIRPLYLGGAGALADKAIEDAEKRAGDASAAAELEQQLLTAKGWGALGAFDPAERSKSLDLLGFDSQLVFPTFAATPGSGRPAPIVGLSVWGSGRTETAPAGMWLPRRVRVWTGRRCWRRGSPTSSAS